MSGDSLSNDDNLNKDGESLYATALGELKDLQIRWSGYLRLQKGCTARFRFKFMNNLGTVAFAELCS